MTLRKIRHRARSYIRRFTSVFTRAERRRMLLLWAAAAPAIIVTVSIILLLALLSTSTASQDNWYAQNAARALAADDPATARLCYASLLQRYPNNQQYQFGLAMALLRLGDAAGASILIQGLAPEDKEGYHPAHIYLAEQILAIKDPPPETLARAERHLQRLLKTDPKNTRVSALLAAIYTEQGRWTEAAPLLALTGPSAGEMGLVVAEKLAQSGDNANAVAWVRRAIRFYGDRVDKNSKDTDARVKLGQAYLMLRDYTAAIEVLQAGWKESQLPVFARGVAHTYWLWVADSAMDADRRLGYTELGLKWDGRHQKLLESLLSTEMSEAATAVVPTTQSIEGSGLRALVSAINGARKDDPYKTKRELSLAISVGGEGFAALAANVACVWAFGEAPDKNASARLSEALLQLRPDDVIAQRAHGLILAKQSDWDNAAKLLEIATSEMPEDVVVHEALANTYEHLGKTELAEHHRALATPSTQPTTSPAPAGGAETAPSQSRESL